METNVLLVISDPASMHKQAKWNQIKAFAVVAATTFWNMVQDAIKGSLGKVVQPNRTKKVPVKSWNPELIW